jgi:hypothetical protein
MTSLIHGNARQHSGVARFERATAALKLIARDLRAVFTNWTAVRRELSDVGRKGNLGARSQRLMRAYY